jgi:amidophosphoribosyltransferase
LSIEGLLEATGVFDAENRFCKACFDGCYPVRFDDEVSKGCLEGP